MFKKIIPLFLFLTCCNCSSATTEPISPIAPAPTQTAVAPIPTSIPVPTPTPTASFPDGWSPVSGNGWKGYLPESEVLVGGTGDRDGFVAKVFMPEQKIMVFTADVTTDYPKIAQGINALLQALTMKGVSIDDISEEVVNENKFLVLKSSYAVEGEEVESRMYLINIDGVSFLFGCASDSFGNEEADLCSSIVQTVRF